MLTAMVFSQTNPDDPPAPPSDVTLLYDHELEIGDGLAFPSLYDPHALFRAHPQFSPTESRFAAETSSSLPSTAPPMYYSPWNNALSGDIGPSVSSPVAGPSNSSVYGTQDASGGDVRHAVVSTRFP
ncbi:hypothetical protein OG21DRAFT_1508221 [Imleria badia]|nr:hypothetical protein OG21DRAFT_1508221 [Imleria badia]